MLHKTLFQQVFNFPAGAPCELKTKPCILLLLCYSCKISLKTEVSLLCLGTMHRPGRSHNISRDCAFTVTRLSFSSQDFFPGYMPYLFKISSQKYCINLTIRPWKDNPSPTIRHSSIDAGHVVVLRDFCSQQEVRGSSWKQFCQFKASVTFQHCLSLMFLHRILGSLGVPSAPMF